MFITHKSYQSFATLEYDECPIWLSTIHALAAFQLENDFSRCRIVSHYFTRKRRHSIANGLSTTVVNHAHWRIQPTVDMWCTQRSAQTYQILHQRAIRIMCVKFPRQTTKQSILLVKFTKKQLLLMWNHVCTIIRKSRIHHSTTGFYHMSALYTPDCLSICPSRFGIISTKRPTMMWFSPNGSPKL